MPSPVPEPSASVPGSPPPSWWARARDALATGAVVRAMLHGFLTVAGLTLLAKGVSFLKDAGIAHRYGISDELDAFNVAFSTLNFAAALLGSGLPSSMMPMYARLLERSGSWRAERLAFQSGLIHMASLIVISLILWLFGDLLTDWLCHGFPDAKRVLTHRLLHELIPFLIFYCMSLHLSNWLRGKMEFAVAALAPVLTPAMILLAIYLTRHEASVEALVLGTNIGSFLTCAVLAWRLTQRFPAKLRWWKHVLRFWEPDLKAALIGAGPFVVATVLIGSSPLIDQAMATPLAMGSVTSLNYSDKVCSIILALTATAAADTMFPFFLQIVAKEDWAGLRKRLVHTIVSVLIIAVPLVLILIWQAPLIVRLLFERGEFRAADTLQVATVLRFAALQIPFYIASLLMSRVVVSLQANSFTLVVTSIALINNIVFNRLLMTYYGAAGIALSTAIVYLVSCVVLFIFLQRRIANLIKTAKLQEVNS